MRLALATLAVLTMALAPLAQAQEGLATTSTVHGRNTVEAPPSGRRAVSVPGNDLPDRVTQGRPTPEERNVERRNDSVTNICKGC